MCNVAATLGGIRNIVLVLVISFIEGILYFSASHTVDSDAEITSNPSKGYSSWSPCSDRYCYTKTDETTSRKTYKVSRFWHVTEYLQ